MRKHIFVPCLIVLASIVFVSFGYPQQSTPNPAFVAALKTETDSALVTEPSLSAVLYDSLQLSKVGLSPAALDYAIKGYEKLLAEGAVQNSRYLTIADFSQSSRKKRLYILDMETRQLAWNTFVSHGKNSGVDMAERFSNIPESEQSSLGFYVTSQTYTGKHGLSLRLNGKDQGFNDNAAARGIVVHGADYVNSGRVNSDYMGRSQGCPALPQNEYSDVINLIKNGSVLFIYSPSENYLEHSDILNG